MYGGVRLYMFVSLCTERVVNSISFLASILSQFYQVQLFYVELILGCQEDQLAIQLPGIGDPSRKRSIVEESEESNNGHEIPSKRIRYGSNAHSILPAEINDSPHDSFSVNGSSSSILDGDLTPVEQMIAMIGALLAEGERGAESLEILISNIHPDLLADIVITNMRHLPKDPPAVTGPGTSPRPVSSVNTGQFMASSAPTSTMQAPVLSAQLQAPIPSATAVSCTLSDMPAINYPATDSKRDPRRVATFLHLATSKLIIIYFAQGH